VSTAAWHQRDVRNTALGYTANPVPSYVRYLKRNGEPSIAVIYNAVFHNSFPVHRPAKGPQGVFVEPKRSGAITCRPSRVCRSRRDYFLPPVERCHAGSPAGDLPDAKERVRLSFGQIGLLTLIFQVTAPLLQPIVGLYTDRRPQPYSLPLGMACSLLGMITLAFANSFSALLAGAALLGIGSSIFHPESSRLARLVSGGAHGFAQSFFQVGGHVGSALGRCWPHSSSRRGDVAALPGLAWRLFWGFAYCQVLDGGTKAPFVPEKRSLDVR
jgi:hypothetical protein